MNQSIRRNVMAFCCVVFFAQVLSAAAIDNIPNIYTKEDFYAYQVTDPRQEARCHNFADYGVQYEFKIIGGQVAYCRDNVYMGEFSYSSSQRFTGFIDHTQWRNTSVSASTPNGQFEEKPLTPVPNFTMIAARNNRIFAYSNETKKFYWAPLVEEFKNDFKDFSHNGAWKSIRSCYSKLDPEEQVPPSSTDPAFTNNNEYHYSLLAFTNGKKLENVPELDYFTNRGVALAGNFPDLKTLTTLKPVSDAIFPDFMQVTVEPGIWNVVDATPPRNNLNASIDQLNKTGTTPPDNSYQKRKRDMLLELTPYMVTIVTNILKTKDIWGNSNEDKLRKILVQMVNEAVATGENEIPLKLSRIALLGAMDAGGYDPIRAWQERTKIFAPPSNWNSDSMSWHKGALFAAQDPTGKSYNIAYNEQQLLKEISNDSTIIVINISTKSDLISGILYEIKYFYDSCITNALDHGDISQTVSPAVDGFISTFKSNVYNDLVGNNTTLNSNFKDAIVKKIDEFGEVIKNSLNNFQLSNLSAFIGSDLLPNTVMSWPNIAKGLNSWYKYFKYPDDVFEMEDIQPYYVDYHNMSEKYKKTQIKIYDVLGIGICDASRYEHYRMNLGAEFGAFFGRIDKPESWNGGGTSAISSLSLPLVSNETQDGHGYCDGTCNFYILATIGMKIPHSKSLKVGDFYVKVPALLWIDEQEYFAERWHVFHPRDNAFEGQGALFSVFPVLTYYNQINMDGFEKNFCSPYANLTNNARLASSGTASVIADDDLIYSSSIYWAVTDQTWRWRNYPDLAHSPNGSIDKQSIKIRDDLTLYFKGTRNLNGKTIDGYWYQSYIGPGNQLPPNLPISNGMPKYGFTHPWNFMGKEAFDYADRNFFKMGLYSRSMASNDEYQHYLYKGYAPKTHIYTFNVSGDKNSWLSSDTRKSFIDQRYVISSSSNKADSICHPMYKEMSAENKRAIVVKFGATTNGAQIKNLFAYYDDPRNDDLKLNTLGDKQTLFCFKVGSSNSTPDIVLSIGKDDILDLNVWSDAPVGRPAVTHSNNSLNISFVSMDYSKYSLKNIVIGIIDNGSENASDKILHKIQLPIPIPQIKKHLLYAEITGTNPTTTTLRDITDSPNDITNYLLSKDKSNYITIEVIQFVYNVNGIHLSKNEWEEYFSEYGRIKYGTSIWVEDEYGNSNVFANLESFSDLSPTVVMAGHRGF